MDRKIKRQDVAYAPGMFDMVKGLGMIQIILTHSSDLAVIPGEMGLTQLSPVIKMFLSITGFALMGMFYVASGVGFRRQKISDCLRKNANIFLKPYLNVVVCVAFIFPLLHWIFFHNLYEAFMEAAKYILAYILGVAYSGHTVAGISIYSVNVVWYLLALFWSFLFLNLVLSCKEKKFHVLLLFFIVMLGIVLDGNGMDYYNIYRGCLALPAVYLGYYMKRNSSLTNLLRTKWKTIFYVLSVILLYICWYYSDALPLYWFWAAKIFSECLFGMICTAFSMEIDLIDNKLTEWIREIGRYSLWIMCIHAVEMTCIPWHHLPGHFPGSPEVCWVTITILRSCIIYLGYRLVKQCDKKFRFWKRKNKNPKGKNELWV